MYVTQTISKFQYFVCCFAKLEPKVTGKFNWILKNPSKIFIEKSQTFFFATNGDLVIDGIKEVGDLFSGFNYLFSLKFTPDDKACQPAEAEGMVNEFKIVWGLVKLNQQLEFNLIRRLFLSVNHGRMILSDH